MYGELIRDAIREEQRGNDARRAAHHTLGMSALGGCREYLRASLADDSPMTVVESDLKWAAMVGTMLGDAIERISERRLGAVTQSRLTLMLNVNGTTVTVQGSADMLFPTPPKPDMPEAVVDLKTVSELYTVRREGPKFGYRAQISGYLLGAIQQGVLSPEAIGELVFFDRSGKDSTTYSWAVTAAEAAAVMEAVVERLQIVVHALDTGQQAPRDEDPSWCHAVGCPFFNGCWGDGSTLDTITDERSEDAKRRYVEAREEVKAWTARRDTARDELMGVSGKFADGTRLTWTERRDGGMTIQVLTP